MEGEVEVDDGVLVLRRIHVVYTLEADAGFAPDHRLEDGETIDRVHGFHARFCPVYRSLEGAIDITTEVRRIDPSAA